MIKKILDKIKNYSTVKNGETITLIVNVPFTEKELLDRIIECVNDKEISTSMNPRDYGQALTKDQLIINLCKSVRNEL